MDSKFKTYQKITITEIRPYEKGEILSDDVNIAGYLLMHGSPKVGDMICRNTSNPNDVWMIDQDYFKKHYVRVGISMTQKEVEKDK